MSKAMMAAAVMGMVVLAAAGGRAWGQPRPGAEDRPWRPVGQPMTLTVTGHGEVSAAPDLAVVQLGATAQAKQAVEAQAKVNETMRGVVEKIKVAGIPAEKIQTARLDLQPWYSDRPNAQNQMELVGYRAASSVRVEVAEIGKVGDVVDAGLGAGANSFEGIYFQLKDDKAARADAIKKAVADAQGKAEAMASAAGVRLMHISEMAESVSGAGFPMPMRAGRMMMAAEAGGGTPVSPGQVKVDADVTVTYRIQPMMAEGGEGGGERPRGERGPR